MMNFGKQGWFGKKIRWRILLFFLVLLWTAALGWGMARAMTPATVKSAAYRQVGEAIAPPLSKSVDPVPERFQLARDLYLEHCGTCHLAIPPAVFPTETWKQLLQNTQEHYGRSLPTITSPEILLMWDYLSLFSRPLNDEEKTPYRFALSRYFNILHPKVKLPDSVTTSTCASCHTQANQFDFRTLAPEWENSP